MALVAATHHERGRGAAAQLVYQVIGNIPKAWYAAMGPTWAG